MVKGIIGQMGPLLGKTRKPSLNLDFKGNMFSYDPHDLYGLEGFLDMLASAWFILIQLDGDVYVTSKLVAYFEV